jgi:uncharacterized protein (TIGR02246 family)
VKRALLLPLALLLFAVSSAQAQDLESVMDRFESWWARGDASAIAGLAARDGITIDLDGKPLGPLGGRQISALLKRLFDDHETIQVRKLVTQVMGGRPARASSEISWVMRSKGTTIPEKTSVFIALVQEGERWRITEIRFVQP